MNSQVDCPALLSKLNIKINTRNLRKTEFFHLGNYRTNYGRFNPLDNLLMVYSSHNEFLLDNNTKSSVFKTIFYNRF